MIGAKNKIGNIENSDINEINQINIEKQENNLTLNNFQMSCANDRFLQMATSHRLFPYFTVDFTKMKNGNYTLMSKPTREESIKKYPLNFKGSFTILDEKYKDIKDRQKMLDIIQFSDSPIEIKINKFEQYLGDVIDPYPNPELSPMQDGVKSYIMPHERVLPVVVWNVDMRFEDSKFRLIGIQLKLVKQISSNTFLLNNYHQKSKPIYLELRLEINDKHIDCNLNYKINETKINDSKTVITYNKFVLNLLTNPYYLYEKKKNLTLMSGKSDKSISQEEINSLNHYINIVERLSMIEKFFDIKFSIPDEISKDDVVAINELYRYIISSKKKEKGINTCLTISKKDMDLNRIKDLINMPRTSLMSTFDNAAFNILGMEINIKKIIIKYHDVKCSNIDEVNEFIKNIEKFDDRDALKIIMVPTNGKYLYKITEIIK